jgi:site-specific recombinase XerD
MPNSHLLGSFVRRFLLESMIADRNLSRNTQKSYRDAIRLLLRFIAERYGIDPTQLTVEDVNAGVVRNFLTGVRHRSEGIDECPFLWPYAERMLYARYKEAL